MRRRHLPPASVLCLALLGGALLGGPGCAARFDGEVDSKAVPTFGTAAFGQSTTRSFFGFGDRVHVVVGILAPGDSCVDGAELLQAQRRLNEAENAAEQQDRATDLADVMNERLPEDAWFGRITIASPDDDDLDTNEVDIGRQDEIQLQLQLCQRSGEVTAVDGRLDTDDDCYNAVDGDVATDRSGDESQILLSSDNGVDFVDENARDEGEVAFTMTLTECEAMTDEVERAFPPG